MPVQRQLTPEELQSLENQGIDSSQYRGKTLNLATDDELAQQQPTSIRQPMSSLGAAGSTLKAHAGGYIGGGAGALGTSAAIAALGLAPETLGGSLLALPFIAAGAAGASYLGQKGQNVLQGQETTQALQEKAEEAAQEHPYVSGVTDIAASALLSGGKPNLSNIPKALAGNRQAIAKIAMNSLVNPAINTGIDYATTGQLPTGRSLLGQALGGALFSESSRLGRLGHANEPASEPTINDNEIVTGEGQGPTSPYKALHPDTNEPLIDDAGIRSAFNKEVNVKPDIKNLSREDALMAMTKYRAGLKTPVDDMRDMLHQKFLNDMASQSASIPIAEPKPEPLVRGNDEQTGSMPSYSNLGDVSSTEEYPSEYKSKQQLDFEKARPESFDRNKYAPEGLGENENPIGDKEERGSWDIWEQHALDYGTAIAQKYPAALAKYKSYGWSDHDSKMAIGKTFIEAMAKKEPLTQKMLDSLHASGAMDVNGSVDKKNSAIAAYNNIREANGYNRLLAPEGLGQEHEKDVEGRIKIPLLDSGQGGSAGSLMQFRDSNGGIAYDRAYQHARQNGMNHNEALQYADSLFTKFKGTKYAPEGLGEENNESIKHPEYGTVKQWYENNVKPLVDKIQEHIDNGNINDAKKLFNKIYTNWRPEDGLTLGELQDRSIGAKWNLSPEQLRNDLEFGDISRDYLDKKLKPLQDILYKVKNAPADLGTKGTDKQQYDELHQKFQDMVQKGQTGTPEFMENWRQMEAVKNRNGGMPPKQYPSNKQTDTPEFKKWFGQSKVVDEKGEPLVVYHGTRSDTPIDIINPSQQNNKGKPREAGPTGFWTTPSRNYAHNYSFDYKGEGKNSGPIYPVHAKAEKIAGYSSGKFIPDEGMPKGKIKVSNEPMTKQEFIQWVDKFGRYPDSSWGLKDGTYLRPRDLIKYPPEHVYDNWNHKGGPTVLDFIPYTHENLASKWDISNHQDRELMRQLLLSHGYDAYWNSGNGRGELAFLKGGEQIKSAIGNKGTFDTNNPSIIHGPGFEQTKFNVPIGKSLANHIRSGNANVQSVLKQIASDKNNPFQALAQRHLDVGHASKMNVPIKVGAEDSSFYNTDTRHISIDPRALNNSHVIMHEIGHALLAHNLPEVFEHARGEQLKTLMDGYLNDPKGNENVKELIRSYYEFAKQTGIHDQLFSDIKITNESGTNAYLRGLAGGEPPEVGNRLTNKIGKLPGYAMANLHEFSDMIMNNRETQELANRMPSGLKDGKSLWSRIVDSVRGILGVPVKERSLLERALKASDKLTQQPRIGEENAITRRVNPTDNRTEHSGATQWENIQKDTEEIRQRQSQQTGSRYSPESESSEVDKFDPNSEEGKAFLERLSTQNPSKDNDFLNNLRSKEYDRIDKRQIELKNIEKTRALTPKEKQEYKALDRRWAELTLQHADENIYGHSGGDLYDGPKYAPKGLGEQEEKELPTRRMGKLGEIFRSGIDTIKSLAHPDAKVTGDAFTKTFQEKEGILGRQFNPVLEKAKGLSKESLNRLDKAKRYELENKKAAPSTMFKTKQEQETWNAYKKSLEQNYRERLANKEPVLRGNIPTLPKRDPFYHPTTSNPKVADVLRANTDQNAIASLNKDWNDYYVNKLKETPADAQQAFNEYRRALQGSAMNSDKSGNSAFFNAARKQQGLPLPPSFERPGFLRNFEAYAHAQSMDNAYYKHVESNPRVMAALGYTHDPWGKPIEQSENGGISGNTAVKNVLNEIKGEATIGQQGRTIAKSESLATAVILGPTTELHKAVANPFRLVFGFSDSPIQMGRLIYYAATHITEGYTHALENGKIVLTARSASDMLDNQLTFADKIAGVARTIRQVYTLNDLTDKFNLGLLQAGSEFLIPSKIASANKGNVNDIRLMQHLDPSFKMGKTYSPKEQQVLASQLVGVIHGTRDARTMPSWMLHDNEISAFFKLSSWGIAQTNSFMRDVYTPATEGNLKPLLFSTFGAAVGGYLVKELRQDLAGKKSQVPSLTEIGASSRGYGGNIPAIAYNMMAAASYAGFGGMLSTIGRMPFDMAFKNSSQGATFPLDAIVSDIANTTHDVVTAIANDPNVNWLELSTHVTGHLLGNSFQLGRVALNHILNNTTPGSSILGTLAEKKMLSDKLGQLRRFDMVEGLPYNEQDASGNPYMNLEQKKFKLEQNPEEAMKMVPELVNNIIQKYGQNPDVMLSKLKALKQNEYSTMPSLEDIPLSFMKYVQYLTRYEGADKAQEAVQDYFHHKIINEAKASVVP